jgi:hypothetical protein
VIAVIILGRITVKPCALFAKVFEVTPKITAKIKTKYELVIFIYGILLIVINYDTLI